MYRKLINHLLVFTVMLLGLSHPAGATNRTALVIGNAEYDTAPLRNPVNDAVDIATALRELGFEVIERTNANKREMILAVDEFARHLQDAEVGIFYFAGHGMQIHGRNYLIPVQAYVTSETDVEFEAMDAGRVLGKMQDAGNKLNIVILDACRDNPFTRSFRTTAKGLAQMDAPTGSIVAYSTAPGSVAADGAGRNGLYTSMLLKYMKIPGLAIEDLFKRVRIGVINATNKKQVPWESSSLTAHYSFSAQRGIAVIQRPKAEELSPERETKGQIKKGAKDIALVGEFLFPDGRTDERIRTLLTSIFSRESQTFALLPGKKRSYPHDILIEGKVISVTKDRIEDKEAQQAQQAANMFKGMLKGFSEMAGDKKTPFGNMDVPVGSGEEKSSVKVRVVVEATYLNENKLISEIAVATKDVSETGLDESIQELVFEATEKAATSVFESLNRAN